MYPLSSLHYFLRRERSLRRIVTLCTKHYFSCFVCVLFHASPLCLISNFHLFVTLKTSLSMSRLLPRKSCSGGTWRVEPPVLFLLLSQRAAGAGQAEAVSSLHVFHPLFSSSLSAYTLCSVLKPHSTLSLHKLARDQECHSKKCFPPPGGQEPYPST